MKIKLKQILESETVLIKIMNSDMPIKISYKLSKLYKEIKEEISNFYEHRDKLLQKFGKWDEKNGNYNIKPDDENYKEFYSEIEKLIDIEIELNYEAVSISELNGIKLSPIEISYLADFIKE